MAAETTRQPRLPTLSAYPAWLEEALPPLAFVVLVCALGPWWSVYELDGDEGFNLMKGLLVAGGHPLYDEVWSDQPPILTYLLAGLFGAVGTSVAAARALILGFAAAAIWALFRIVRRQEGPQAAWLAVAVLGSSTLFQRLGVSVMVGLPAIAFTLLAFDQIFASADGRRWRLWLAGALLACSLLVKLFTAIAIPAALWAVALSIRASTGRWQGREVLAALLEHLLAALLTFGTLLVLAHPDFVADLVAPHTAPALEQAFRYEAGWPRLWSLLGEEPVTLALAAAGLVLAPAWRRPQRTVPLFWLAVGLLAFRHQAPVWYHHALLFTVPLAWIAGGAASVLGAAAAGRGARLARGLSLAVMLGCAPPAIHAAARTWAAFHEPESTADRQGLDEIRRFGAAADWMVTDRPMDAFRAGIPVPPPLAVYSLKREKSGNLPAAELVAALRTYQPALFSSRRIRVPADARKLLKDAYDMVVDRDDHTLYVRRSGGK